jgi:hypothetical protein
VKETISSGLLAAQANANDNVVDWILLELRKSGTPTSVLQSRSALLLADGDVVDIDGASPVYFKNLEPASDYIISVKHRNHIAICTNTGNPFALGLNSTNVNFGTSSLLGVAGQNFQNVAVSGLGNVNVMYAGNANTNTITNYNGFGNDRAAILSATGGANASVLNAYRREDVNMNLTVNYNGFGNDRALVLTAAGGANSSKTQASGF